MHNHIAEAPWYRQLWPWILITLPASAVLGCAVTIWLVMKAPDREIAHEAPLAPVNDVLNHNSIVPPKK